jgi:imidazolonepropionase-like amidohydrolase
MNFKQILTVALISFVCSYTYAQGDLVATNCYFIQNATVVQKPGTVIPKTNILLRDGIIKGIGPTLTPPFDAKIIKADSMYVYAAFVDAMSDVGIKKAETTRRDPNAPRPSVSNPTLEQSGVTPQRSIVDVFKNTESSVTDLRNIGYGVAHVMPDGLMLPGKTSVFTLSKNKTSDLAAIKKDYGLYARMASARGVSPGTMIGVMAKYRDLFRNASAAAKNQKTFDMPTTKGMARPQTSAELAALIPAAEKSQKVFFEASKTKDIHRVMMLQKELGFDLVISGTSQVSAMASAVKAGNFHVIQTLKLPEEIKQDTTSSSDSTKTAKKKVLTDEEKAFEEKKMVSYKAYVAEAANLSKMNIPFSFGTMGAKTKDVKGNLAKMIKSGLSEQAALTALTTSPAALLGVSNLVGTVEEGKLANIFITDTSYFAEKSKIKMVFVEGELFEMDNKPKSDSKGSSKLDLAGVWSYEIDIPGMTQTGRLTVKKMDNSYAISISDNASPSDVEQVNDVELSDESLSFFYNYKMGGQPIKVTFKLTMEKDKFSGTVSVPQFGSFPVTGAKIP